MDNNNSPRNGASDIVNELGRLGENLGNLLRGAWQSSEERKYVETELRSGLEQLNKRLNISLDQLNLEDNARKARENAKSAWETAHGPQIVSEARQGMADSLRRLNEELAKRAEPKAAHEPKQQDESMGV